MSYQALWLSLAAQGISTIGNSGANLVDDAKSLYNNITGEGTGKVHQNGTFENAPYHGKVDNSVKSRALQDGQAALDNSVPVSPDTTTRRVGVSNNEIVVLDETTEGVFHGHVRSWEDLTPKMQNALRKAGLVDKKGKIISNE